MLHNPKQLRSYIRFFVIACVLFLFLLSLFQWIWVLGGSGTSIMYEAGLQRTLVDRIAKDVFTLAYRPTSEHAQAVNELQNILPIFEKIQHGLQSGDASLGLPHRPPDVILQFMITSQPDFAAIDTAARQIIAQPDKPVDKIEVDIIAAHERAYFLVLSQVNTVWQQYIDGAFIQIFAIEEGIVILVVTMLVVNYTFVSRKIYNRLVEEEQEQKEHHDQNSPTS